MAQSRKLMGLTAHKGSNPFTSVEARKMSVNSYYEAHITMIGTSVIIEPIVKSLGWKFSQINGDPTLGKGIKCYATKHSKASKDKKEVLIDLQTTADSLQEQGCEVIRRKIELVIYDDRSSTVRFTCDGTCPECHMDDIVNECTKC